MMNSVLQKQMLEKFNCEKCRFSTKDPNKYRNHVSLHNDIKFACLHCDFVSYTKTEFQRHLVTHTGKFPYTCGYCGYGAIRNDYIVKHIRRIHGDGKIQCSVSTVENESKKASINIMQTQVITSSIQNVLQNSPSSVTEDVIDLTAEVDSLGSSSSIFPNGNKVAGHVEVEVISPVDQQLYPWIPLTVVAPTSFKVPPNCIAQVVEVKPINSACHLVLKCLNLLESSVPNQPVIGEHIYEHKAHEHINPSKLKIEKPDEPLSQECSELRGTCQENVLYPNTVCGTEENLHTNVTCPADNTSKIINAIKAPEHDKPSKPKIENPDGPLSQECSELRGTCQENVLYPNTVCGTEKNLHTNVTCPADNTCKIINAIKAPEYNKPSKPKIENPDGPLSQECSELRGTCQENVLYPNTVCGTEENLHTNVTCPADNTSKIINAINDVVSDMFEDLEEFSGGPIISSVFSLSSDSKNTIEGIQWECPFSSSSTTSPPSDDVDATQSSLNTLASQEEPTVCDSELNLQMNIDKSQDLLINTILDAKQSSLNTLASQEEPTVCDSELNLQMDIDKSQDLLINTVLESDKEPCEMNMENVKQSTDPEIQMSIESEPTDVQKLDIQSCALDKSKKSGRIYNRLGKIETNNFSKPQVLFLSCDKRIVMQPLSCTLQNNNKTTSPVDKVTDQVQVPVKMRRESAKAKVKKLVAPALKSRCQPNLRTLRLHPFKVDQVAHAPSYNQPVVVLNHPDLESIETSHIMKAIRCFRGKVTKITLSKQMCKKYV